MLFLSDSTNKECMGALGNNTTNSECKFAPPNNTTIDRCIVVVFTENCVVVVY